VSFQIKQLENELGCLLFERINHTIMLTDKGEELLSFARQIRYLTDEFNQRQLAPQDVSGFVRIVTADSICEEMMKRNYRDFHRYYPRISLQYTTADTDTMFQMLDRNEADLMMTLDSHVYHKDYIIAKEEPVPMHFVTGADSPYASSKEMRLKDIVSYPFILTERGIGYRRILDERLAMQMLDIQPILEIARTDIIVSMLENGIGVSFLPEFVTAQKVREGKLVYLHIPEMQSDIWKQLIYHKNKWMTESMKAVIRYIKQNEFTQE
jgi:DNA-binding transcriptional LysR family regulator